MNMEGMVAACNDQVTTPTIEVRTNAAIAKPGWPPVLIGGTTQTAVVLMRDLARRGVSAWCTGTDSRANGFRTVYGKGIKAPDPDEQPAEWITHMLATAKVLGNRPVLIAAGDHYVSAVLKHADELRKEFRFCHSAMATLALLSTKQRQYSTAFQHGMPIPRSQWAENLAEVISFASKATYPCVLKPSQGRQWEFGAPRGHVLHGAKVAVATTPDELIAKYKLAAEIDPAVIVQEVIQGPDSAKLVYLSCYGSAGDRLAACLFRELRTFPMQFGSASVVEPVVDPEADSLCDQFLRKLGYAGLCEIELKRDCRDGNLKMIEANPRYSGTADAAPYSGVPLGWIHYLDLIGEAVVPVHPNDRHFRHITLCRDVRTVGNYVAAGIQSWREIVLSYRPPVVFFDLSFRDWRPTARTIGSAALFIAGRLYRRVFPRSFPAAESRSGSPGAPPLDATGINSTAIGQSEQITLTPSDKF